MTQKSDRQGHIRIFLRARPTRRASRNAQIDREENRIAFTVPKDKATGYSTPTGCDNGLPLTVSPCSYVNNSTEYHAFCFDGVFDTDATQEHVTPSDCPFPLMHTGRNLTGV